MADIFISYARADDEPFVEQLYKDLARDGFAVWWDRKTMESRGRTFLQEIRDAVASVERVILVVGPKAVRSEYVRAEWQFALEACKIVIPIVRLGDASAVPAAVMNSAYSLMPEEVSQFHAPNFLANRNYDAALAELERILSVPIPGLAEMGSVTELPPNHLPRHDLLKRLRQTVLADVHGPVTLKHDDRIAALVGMGGAGKSVAAAAFARACGTRRAMDGGIHWLKFGEMGDPVNNLHLLAEFVGAPSNGTREPELLKSRIAAALSERSCLVVLDDVFEMKQVTPFRDGLGPRCRLLITTRNRKLALALKSNVIPVEVLAGEAARELLALHCGLSSEALPEEADTILHECGNLPLAIAMIGAALRGNPDRWNQISRRLQKADLERIAGDVPNYDHPNLLKAMEVSIGMLSSAARKRYFDLAVFPEDASIPEAVCKVLWSSEGLSADAVEDVLDELVDKSLAVRDSAGRIGIHDLQLDYVRAKAKNVQALHLRLLENYSRQCDGDWTSGPNDGYLLDQLSHHLCEADRAEELVTLITDSPAWMIAKREALGSNRSFLKDIDRAFRHSTDTISIARLAAARAMVQQQSELYSYALLQALVWLDRTEEARGYAMICGTPLARFNALYAVWDAARKRGDETDPLIDQLTQIARSITPDQMKTDALRGLAAALGEAKDNRSIPTFRIAREAAHRIPAIWTRAQKLVELAAAMPEASELREATLDDAWKLVSPRLSDSESTNVQMETALGFADAGQFDRAEAVAEGMTHEGWKENSRGYLAKAYAEAGKVDEAWDRTKRYWFAKEVALPEVAASLVRARRFSEAFSLVADVKPGSEKARILWLLGKALAADDPKRSAAAFTAAWRVTRQIPDFDSKIATLCNLALAMADSNDRRSGQVCSQAMNTLKAHKKGDQSSRDNAIYNLVLTLTRMSRLDEALELAGSVPESGPRSDALSVVAEAMARSGHPGAPLAVDRVIADATTRRDDPSWSENLGSFALFLASQNRFTAALRSAASITDHSTRLNTLISLGACLAHAKDKRARTVLGDVLSIVPRKGYGPDLAKYLRLLAAALVAAGDSRANFVIKKGLRVALNAESDGSASGLIGELAIVLYEAGYKRSHEIAATAEALSRQGIPLGGGLFKPRASIECELRLIELGVQLDSCGQPHGLQLLREVERRTALSKGENRQELSARLARAYARAGQIDAAERLSHSLDSEWAKADVQKEIVAALSRAERWEQAWRLAVTIQEDMQKAESLVDLSIAMVRKQAKQVGKVVNAAVAATHALDPSAFKTQRQAKLILPLILLNDERAHDFWVEARAGAGGANWTGIKAAALVEAGRLSEALQTYEPSNTDAFIHTLMCWSNAFDYAQPQSGLAIIRAAAQIFGWVVPDWKQLHDRILRDIEDENPLPVSSSPIKPIPEPNSDTAIFSR